MGVPYAVALGLLVAILDLIPLAGATIAGIIVGTVAFLHSVPAGIVIVVFFIVYQQLENHILQPLIYGRTVQLSPLVVLVSVLVGAELAGVLGALGAIPVAGSIQVLVARLAAQRRPSGPSPRPRSPTVQPLRRSPDRGRLTTEPGPPKVEYVRPHRPAPRLRCAPSLVPAAASSRPRGRSRARRLLRRTGPRGRRRSSAGARSRSTTCALAHGLGRLRSTRSSRGRARPLARDGAGRLLQPRAHDGSAFWKRIKPWYGRGRASGRSARTSSGRRPTSADAALDTG